jgi:hypothetical protein
VETGFDIIPEALDHVKPKCGGLGEVYMEADVASACGEHRGVSRRVVRVR